VPCSACPPGTYKPVNGSAPCINCARGKYSIGTGMTSEATCSGCPTHTYSREGSSKIGNCTCNKGYTGADGETCTACATGTFKDVNGSEACSLCPDGKYSTSTGAISEATCDACPAASSSGAGSDEGTDCVCNMGYTGPAGGECSSCAAGTFKNVTGSSVCLQCSWGKYSIGTGMTSEATCSGCPPHTYSGEGSSKIGNCTCNKGYTGADGEACTACAAGTFKDVNGSSPCSLCPGGTYSTLSGAVSVAVCGECALDSFAEAGSDEATDCKCNIGFTGPGGGFVVGNGSPCAPCLAGTFKDTLGSLPCTDCPASTYSVKMAATSLVKRILVEK